jgi:hypothetical protein
MAKHQMASAVAIITAIGCGLDRHASDDADAADVVPDQGDAIGWTRGFHDVMVLADPGAAADSVPTGSDLAAPDAVADTSPDVVKFVPNPRRRRPCLATSCASITTACIRPRPASTSSSQRCSAST